MVASNVTPSTGAAAASASALAWVRFQIATRSMDGRTEQCARMRCGACAPAPTMQSEAASSRARNRAPRAESAAVFQYVSSVPSRLASGSPFAPSKSR